MVSRMIHDEEKKKKESGRSITSKPYPSPSPQKLDLSVLQINLGHCLEIIEDEVMKGYVTRLADLAIIPSEAVIDKRLKDIHFFRISELVYQENEFVVDKLSMVYSALSNKPCTLVLLLRSDGAETQFYLGARPNGNNSAGTLFQMLKQSLIGFFPGSKIEEYYDEDMKKDMQSVKAGCVSAVTCIADYKQKDNNLTNEAFLQGLEKFVYSMQGKKYTAVLIADSVGYSDLMYRKKEYEQIYTQVSPFSEMQLSFAVSDGSSTSTSDSEGNTKSTAKMKSQGKARSVSQGSTVTSGSGESIGSSDTSSENNTVSDSSSNSSTHTTGSSDGVSRNETRGYNIGGYSGVSTNKGIKIGPASGGVGMNSGVSYGYNHSVSNGTSHMDSVSDAIARTLSHGTSKSVGSSHSDNRTVSRNESISKAVNTAESTTWGVSSTEGEAFNFVNTKTMTETFGSSRSITLNASNMTLKLALNRIEKHLNRIEECESFGMWNFAAYFLGDAASETETAANTYKSVIAGTDSGIERSAINTWIDNDSVKDIESYIRQFVHPQFIFQRFSYDKDEYVAVTPSAMVSTKELAIHLGLPRKSVCGLPVIKHADFGKEVIRYEQGSDERKDRINLGKVFHMGKAATNNIALDKNSLSMHTFVTGSTGSGKSNTVYELIRQTNNRGVNVMVIEPAKGEYKHVFGNHAGVHVYGTNPEYADLIHINPFRFPKGIHVLEHVDRLVEIFNVCWPMYAAMPSVLKEGLLQSYETCGWDLSSSRNAYDDNLFPTFVDLQSEMVNVIRESAYSEEVKSNYMGSLVTRVKSLTNGLNGQIFSSNEIPNNTLFDQNVIVDLSRIGSLETKSLIMGILIMRLSEHRMSFTKDMNVPLKHITVLEEAHNILKRISTEQSLDGANVAGKSVEMISNAIAEMRTFGEGFVIVDQSPNAVDISAIRNTNTKIIMRLPDESDRYLAGKSAGLKEEQLDEIAKLPKGVAVIYQNDWVEPLLCKINKYSGAEGRYVYKANHSVDKTVGELRKLLLQLFLMKRAHDEIKPDIDRIHSILDKTDLSGRSKLEVKRILHEYKIGNELSLWKDEEYDALSKIVSSLLDGNVWIQPIINMAEGFDEVTYSLLEQIEKRAPGIGTKYGLLAAQCLLKKASHESDSYNEIYAAWISHIRMKGVV